MSALVDKAEFASAGGRPDTGTSSGAAAAAAAASLGPQVEHPRTEPPKDPQNDPNKNPQDEPRNEPTQGQPLGDEAQLSPTPQGLNFSINLDGDAWTDAGGRLGRRKKQPLQRQHSSFESIGAASSASARGGEERSALGAFLSPEEEQVEGMHECLHLVEGYERGALT